MGFGENAAVIAAHGAMVLINSVVVVRVVVLMGSSRPSGGGWLFPASIAMYLFAIDVERMYYIAARVFPQLDLWGQHPAPAFLSAIVAASAYWFMPPIFRAYGWSSRRIAGRCAIELACFGLLWLCAVAILR